MILAYEAAWNRAIAPQDRLNIEQLFEEMKSSDGHTIIRTATNYKNQLLVSVLVFNRTPEVLQFKNTPVQFQQVTQNFTTEAISIPAFTAMPWTFIFDATEGYDLKVVKNGDFQIL